MIDKEKNTKNNFAIFTIDNFDNVFEYLGKFSKEEIEKIDLINIQTNSCLNNKNEYINFSENVKRIEWSFSGFKLDSEEQTYNDIDKLKQSFDNQIINFVHDSFIFYKTIILITDLSSKESLIISLVINKMAEEKNVFVINIFISPYILEGDAKQDVCELSKIIYQKQNINFIEISSNQLINNLANTLLGDIEKIKYITIAKITKSFLQIITKKTDSGVSFLDLRNFFANKGKGFYISYSNGVGKNKIEKCVKGILKSKISDADIKSCYSFVLSIVADVKTTMNEIRSIIEQFKNCFQDRKCQIMFNYVVDKKIMNEINLTLIGRIDSNYEQIRLSKENKVINRLENITKTLELNFSSTLEKENTSQSDIEYLEEEVIINDDDDFDEIPSFLK